MEQVFALIRSLCFAHRTMVPLFTFFFHKWQCVWFESMVAGWQFHIRPSYFFQCCFDSECAPVHEEVTLGLLNFEQDFLSNYPNTYYFSICNLEYCLFYPVHLIFSSFDFWLIATRDVTAGATDATAVAPKFSDTLTLFQPGGTNSAKPSHRLHPKFPRGYISGTKRPKYLPSSYFFFSTPQNHF